MSKLLDKYLEQLKEAKQTLSIMFFFWGKSSPSNAWKKSDNFKKIKKFLNKTKINYRIVNYEKDPSLFKKYGVRGAPWTVYLRGGKKCNDAGGLLTTQEFMKWLRQC